MIDYIVRTIKTNIAQRTSLFDSFTQTGVTVTANKNVVENPIISGTAAWGEYTFSGGSGANFNEGSINDTFDFEATGAVTDIYFGATASISDVTAHKVDVGSAISKRVAMEVVTDERKSNCIIVYNQSCSSVDSAQALANPFQINARYTFGVLFKLEATQAETLRHGDLDSLFVNAVMFAGNATYYDVKFSSIAERSLIGNSYVVDIIFSYTKNLAIDDEFISTLRNYDATIEPLKVT